MKKDGLNALLLGLIASFFFSITFILNRSVALDGSSWMWTASLRYFFMLPCLIILVLLKKQLGQLIKELKYNVSKWILWSTIGFGLFYSCLSYAAEYAPAWLIASTWQITIIAGLIIQPYVSHQTKRIPLKIWLYSIVIILGIILTQFHNFTVVDYKTVLKGVVPVAVAGFAYPLGNRKMMIITGGRITSLQRVLGMTIASTPYWLILSLFAQKIVGTPDSSQIIQALVIALGSGVIATTVFFKATDMVRKDSSGLASVEATQSSQIIFTLAGEFILLKASLPDIYSIAGIVIVILGIILHSFSMKEP